MDDKAINEKPRTVISTFGKKKIKEAANTSKNRLNEISLVWSTLSASNPLGTEKTNEKTRGIDTMMPAKRIESPYSSIRIGKRASGRFV